ncbi:ABC transporter permease [Actinosynnema sp. NPDC047251]|uniref:ABC-type di-/oligopeptide transporter, permease subunit n=1 Tax=Saccharothrix espanaensis (strain ATCC 51144 / DSM 44229 / JCM 9112 / NBRC 15066 / NRRL 15764) TaxID=1179773 RepID=K0JRQ5_SACES|nr:ABC transporter permease [Saccharothrix espanaensis]CCH28072.1 ABC-type di-/oligopeptide transporter, permease subunit [Saccharothrix espanaensis DSM 44229]
MTEQITVLALDKPRGLFGDAWHALRFRPVFWVSVSVILLVVLMALFPRLFAPGEPYAAVLSRSRQGPSADAWFGFDQQGYDIYTRVVHGTRASIVVGLLATIGVVVLGSAIGILAGFYGKWVDAVVSRIADIFVGVPFVLGAIVILTTVNAEDLDVGPVRIVAQVVLSIAVLSWPVSMRIMRSTAIAAKQQDYVKAARALGASPRRIITKHMLPNCVAPVLVYSTIALGAFIGAEATLTYLGIGLRNPVVSWGVLINDATKYVRVAPHALLFPAGFLTATVLAFVMLGDAVREALDPKLR